MLSWVSKFLDNSIKTTTFNSLLMIEGEILLYKINMLMCIRCNYYSKNHTDLEIIFHLLRRPSKGLNSTFPKTLEKSFKTETGL